MAAPNPFQYLKHGVLLCKKNFDTFVETFNFLIDFARNIRGDGENNGSGIIVVDRKLPDRPIIRSKVNMEMIKALEEALPGCFEYAGEVDQSGVKRYGRPYFMMGSRLYRAQNAPCGTTEGIDYLRVQMNDGQMSATIGHAQNYSMLQTAAEDQSCCIFPLYEFDSNGQPIADLRNIPNTSSWELST